MSVLCFLEQVKQHSPGDVLPGCCSPSEFLVDALPEPHRNLLNEELMRWPQMKTLTRELGNHDMADWSLHGVVHCGGLVVRFDIVGFGECQWFVFFLGPDGL